MSGAMLAAIIGGLVLLMIVIVVIAILKGGFTKVTTIAVAPAEGAPVLPVRKPSEVAPPATLRTAITIAMHELRVLVGGGRGPIDVPWALAVGAGGEALAALLPPPLGVEHEVSWLDEQKMARLGTVSFREGGVVLGFEDGLVGQVEAERRLRDLLREVEGVRPDRPIDSLLVVVPWSLLASGDAEAVAAHGRHLYELILTVQQRTGWRVPVYILLGGGEQVPGFAAVARALLAHTRSPVIGWPAPRALDSMFEPSWIDDAFDAMRTALSIEQLHLLMGLDSLATEEAVLLFPERLAAIKPAMKAMLAQMLESSAYHEGFMLRGIFLTGDSEPPPVAVVPAEGAEPPPPNPEPLAQILFRDKIFPESKLAQPAYGERTRRHRMVRRAQWSLVAALALFALGLAAIPIQAANRIPPVYALLLNILKIEEAGKAQRDLSGNCVERPAALAEDLVQSESFNTNRRVSVSLLERMSELDLNRIETALAPTSFLSGANWKVESAIKRSFHDVVFTAISESMTTRAGIRELVTRNTPENDFEGYWKATVENVVAYDRHYRLLREMQDKEIHDAGLLRGFSEIVQYALGEELPPEFKRNYRVYSEGLAEYPVPCLYSSIVRTTLNDQLAQRYGEAVRLIYRENPLARAWEVTSRLFPLEDEADPEPPLRELADEIDLMDKELTNPRRYAWIYAPAPGDLPMPRTDALLKLEGPDRDIVARLPIGNLPTAIGAMETLRAAKLFEVPVLFEDTGPKAKEILAKPVPPGSMAAPTHPGPPAPDPGLPALTKGVTDTRDFLRTMFGQPFMAAGDPTRTYYAGPRPGWEYRKLQIAQEAVKSYTEFVASGSGEMPAQLRALALETAERRFTRHIEHLVNEAAQPLSSVVNPALSVAEGEAANFALALPVLTSLRNALRDAGAGGAASRLDARVSAQAAQLLVEADRDLAGGAFYGVHAEGLRRWDGTGSLAAAAFGVNSVDDLKGSLPDRRLGVAAIARARAAPAVAYLRDPATIVSANSLDRASRWQSILQTLEAYDASAPNNSLAELEQFMTVDLDKLQWRDCARLRVPAARRRDYFSEQRTAIARQIVARCRSVATETADAQFARLRQTFNDTLAGRFPFSAQVSAPGADPADVQAFFLEFGEMLQPLKNAIDQDTGFGDSGRAVSATLDRLIRVRAVLAPMLDAGQARLAYGVGVEFFPAHPLAVGQAQVIGAAIGTPESQAVDNGAPGFTWVNGDPVTTRLRWAANAPTLPVTPNQTCTPQPGGNIVTFETEGDWALLRFLRERGPEPRAGGVAAGIPVAFEVDLCENRARASGGDPVRARARVFLRLTLSQTVKVPDQPDKQSPVVLPPFPDRIPALVRPGRGG